ncbi:FecR family protein [Sphingomonas kyeonggiensis]|uniref:Transmembrane sensor n=1 Tax=Sphingomonas kyeonggiensis TaxID=1268553 RepID=A0A7W6NYJ0_9SPHN|nr:FecR domain-containing protein [Sphingomonas kyeonggiensis]MBB4100403.1 transmembrane sensor [Sphingomonas kyeonggiensis]
MKRGDDKAIIAEAARLLAEDLCRKDLAQDEASRDDSLQAWRVSDPRHDTRLAEMEAIWRDLGAVAAPVTARLPPTVPRRRRGMRAPTPRRAAQAGAAIAAAIAITVLTDLPLRLQADLRTNVGERRIEKLADGSRVWLDTNSAVALDFTANRRDVRLLRGRAEFEVAPDRSRPFTVDAGSGATTALGTRFIVRRQGDAADVTVTEHAVQVALDNGARARIAEGQTVRYQDNAIGAVRPANREAAMAWTRGWLVFEDARLGTVVDELARYHPGLIQLVGSDLADRRVSGSLAIDDPEEALRALEALLHLRATRIGSVVIFLHA